MAKFFIISTSYKDNVERATLPWVEAVAANAEDHEVIVFLQGPAVRIATRGCARALVFPPFPPICELMDTFMESGGKVFVCGTCMQAHEVAVEDLIEGVDVAGVGFLVHESANARIISY
jgi:predicted peroxiredoxin